MRERCTAKLSNLAYNSLLAPAKVSHFVHQSFSSCKSLISSTSLSSLSLMNAILIEDRTATNDERVF
jgi:hypothetical protein